MNTDDDYDNDGNNIVPCPMCMSNYNPCKEGGRCPAEYSFIIEGEVRLLLDEFETTGDRSRIANVMEAVDKEIERVRDETLIEAVRVIEEYGESMSKLHSKMIGDAHEDSKMMLAFDMHSRLIAVKHITKKIASITAVEGLQKE